MTLFQFLRKGPSLRYLLYLSFKSASSRTPKNPVQIPKATRISEPWNERKGVWQSTLSYFQPKTNFIGPDLVRIMQTPIDLSAKNVKKWYDKRMVEQEEENQKFVQERFDILGPDLAAAHFVVYRGGAVRFYNESEWITRKDDGSYLLPSRAVPGLYIEAIDCSGFILRWTGLENILDLEKLRWLRLANNPFIDDWSLDSVSGSYGETLQYFDISNCPKISYRGLSCFYRFQKLDTLIVTGISDSPEFKLSCMMLEDIRPMLTIKGIDYLVPTEELVDPSK